MKDDEYIAWKYRFINRIDGTPISELQEGFNTDKWTKAKYLYVGIISLIFGIVVLPMGGIGVSIIVGGWGIVFGMLSWSILYHDEGYLHLQSKATCLRCGSSSHHATYCERKYPFQWWKDNWDPDWPMKTEHKNAETIKIEE